jgi:hypothetical protein
VKVFYALSLLGLGISSVFAEGTLGHEANWTLRQSGTSWLQANDPTLLSPRLQTQWEHEDRSEGDSSGKVFVNLREAVLLSPNLAFGIQAEIPLQWASEGGEDFSGLGDAEFRVGFVSRLSPKWRFGLGLNGRFDSASEAELGDGLFELRPIAALRWDASKQLNLGLNVERTFTPSPIDQKTVETLQIRLPIVVKLNHSWSGSVSYQPKWNLAKGDSRSDRLDLSATVVLGKSKHVALTFGVEIPLSADTLDAKSFVGLQWFYR